MNSEGHPSGPGGEDLATEGEDLNLEANSRWTSGWVHPGAMPRGNSPAEHPNREPHAAKSEARSRGTGGADPKTEAEHPEPEGENVNPEPPLPPPSPPLYFNPTHSY